MRKRRKVLVILGLIALAAVCFVILLPRDEPKYQGHYLSEWMELYSFDPEPYTLQEWEAAQYAIESIGTNALPYYLKWLRSEPEGWRITLRNKMPGWIKDNSTVYDWAIGSVRRRAKYGQNGIGVLGTNAASAIPELEAMLKDRTRPMISRRAAFVLGSVGERAIPILRTALADTNQVGRTVIVFAVRQIALNGHTNACLPIIMGALNDGDVLVRDMATNGIRQIAPEMLPTGESSNLESQQ